MQDGLVSFLTVRWSLMFSVRMAVTEVKREPVDYEVTTLNELMQAPSSKVSSFLFIIIN